jgi:RND family efflux transporter MFP subunit
MLKRIFENRQGWFFNLLRSKTLYRWLGFLLLLVGFFVAIRWSTIPQVVVVRAERGTAEELVIGSLEVSEYHTLQLRSQRNGIVIESFVEIGDRVSEGQVLMRLDTDDQQLELERLLIERDNYVRGMQIKHQSEYTLERAKETLEDFQRDFERGVKPRREVEAAEREMRRHMDEMQRVRLTQELNLATQENKIKQLRLDIERMTIRSPVSGVITDIKAREGDLVSAETVIFEVIDARRLVVAEISEEDYNKVNVGMDASVWFLAYPNQTFRATVSQILPTANPITQRYKAYLNVDIDGTRLTPGLTGEVSIVAARRDYALMIPSQSVLGNHVFRVKDSRIDSVRIERGYKGLMAIEVLSGLREGDVVVSEDLTRFKHGDLVRIQWMDQARGN